jgi:hypothetical protein
MKQSVFIFLCIAFFSCSNPPKPEETKTDSTAQKVVYNYPYTPKYPINWKPGDEKNAVLVLNSLKKYIDGDLKGAFTYLADSIEFIADKFHFKGKKDSLYAMFIPMSAQMKSMSVVIDTWITAYYPDSNQTWVTVWYTQTYNDKKGKTDSVYLTDDYLMKDDKIALIDEKQRLFPAPMKKK